MNRELKIFKNKGSSSDKRNVDVFCCAYSFPIACEEWSIDLNTIIFKVSLKYISKICKYKNLIQKKCHKICDYKRMNESNLIIVFFY